MKTTSYEISKKLAEAGFVAETEFGYDKLEQIDYSICRNSLIHTKTYDLETIWDALPKTILDEESASFEESLVLRDDCISFESEMTVDHISIEIEENESLADAAARLLLLLVKKGLITFNK